MLFARFKRFIFSLIYLTGFHAVAEDQSCRRLIDQLSLLSKSDPPSLLSLQEALKKSEEANGYVNHKLTIVDGKGHLQIGLLESSSTDTFMITAYQAVKEGSITSIDAGTLVGPKVIPMLERLRKAAPVGTSLKITGTLSPRDLYDEVVKKTTTTLSTDPSKRADQFTRAEADKVFKQSRAIGLTAACEKLFGKKINKCPKLIFEIDSSAAEPYKWKPAD